MSRDSKMDTSIKHVGKALSFFASVIKSGEPWTPTCQAALDLAREDLSRLSGADSAAYYRAALQKITQREGRFSRDQLTHAGNTIEDMAAVAEGALAGTWELDEPLSGAPGQKFTALLDAYTGAVYHNARIDGMESLSAYHEEERVDEDTPRKALLEYVQSSGSPGAGDGARDTERLDWLEREHSACGTWWSTDGEGFPEGFYAEGDGMTHRSPTLRAAIDAAMQSAAALSSEEQP